MKNIILFTAIMLCYFILMYLDKTYIATSSKMIDFLAKDYPSKAIQNYIENQKKWWWISYAILPFTLGIKILLVAFCLNFIKLLDLQSLKNVKFTDILTIVLIAESVFIIAGFYKFVNFYWINTNYTLENIQTYSPISLLNLKEEISSEKWLAYPLQLVNLFELLYWGILAWGIWELSENKISFPKSLGLTMLTYGVGLLFWTGVVSLLILNVQS